MAEKKGTKYENEAMSIYKSFGFQAWKPANASRRIGTYPDGRPKFINMQQDIASAYDFIAWDEREVHLVQVKSDEGNASRARKKIDSIIMPTAITQVVLMRIYRKKERFVAWVLQHDRTWLRLDYNFSKDRMIE